MAKETAAQRKQREATEREMARALAAATYLERLMALMQRAQVANFELEVADMTFRVWDRSDRDYETVVLELTYSENAESALDELEWQVKRVEEERAEAERKYLAKQTALAKLTKEEKELLGL